MFRHTVIALALGLWPAISSSLAGTIYVGGSEPGNYSTIQAGIDAANPGDIVFVYDDSSPYYEHVTINKSIALVGENRDTTVIDGGGITDVVFVAASGAAVSHFTVRNSAVAFAALRVISSVNNATLADNLLTGNYIGIRLGGKYSTIAGNVITGNTSHGIEQQIYSAHVAITDNTIQANGGSGVSIQQSNYDLITGNTISDNGAYGIYITNSGGLVAYHNNLLYNQVKNANAVGGTWDNGYPDGGNYWSDYTGMDLRHGAYLEYPGSDGIGDTPTTGPVDNYPLMMPYPRGNLRPYAPFSPRDLPPIYVPTAMRVGPGILTFPGCASGALRRGRSRGFGGRAPKDRHCPANAAGVW